MKKLFAAVPVVGLMGIWLASACSSDQGGVVGGGTGGSSTGTGGTTQTGGSSAGTGGTQAGTGGSTGTGGSGTGGSTGTGGGGTGGSTGTGGSGTGGSTGTGGTVVDASAGTGGREAGPAMDAATAPPDVAENLMAVAAPLNGVMLTGPCVVEEQASVCHTVAANAACPANNDRALAGVLTTDRTVRLGGNPGQQYTITLHIQGEVESKQYPGGVDQEATLTSPRADGWIVGGTPTTADNYNVYMIRVTNPNAPTAAPVNYYMNSLQNPGRSNHTTYGIDYLTGTRAGTEFKVMGGSTLRLVAGDSNCDMIKNCGPIENNGTVCSGPIVMTNIEPDVLRLNPNFNFTTPYNGQWLAITVKNVTSP